MSSVIEKIIILKKEKKVWLNVSNSKKSRNRVLKYSLDEKSFGGVSGEWDPH